MGTKYLLTAVGILLAVSIIINIFLSLQYNKTRSVEAKYNVYDHFNSLLSNDVFMADREDQIINFVPLRKELTDLVASQSADVQVGLYFEYIPNGNSIGILDRNPFVYASLLKVPLVMTIYQKIERGNLKLTDEFLITEAMIDKKFGDLWKKAGTKISVQEAIRHTLIESDDTAAQFLRSLVTVDEFMEIFPYLDIPVYVDEKQQPAVTPKNYTSVLRSLYNASFLSKENSEEILKILSRSTYNDGIRKNIPDSVTIAHKMGVRAEYQLLSDCGIIYVPKRPYYLCVMINDKDVDHATTTLQKISTLIYTYISKQ